MRCDPSEIQRVFIALLREGTQIRSWAGGNSMAPFIRKGDFLTVRPIAFPDVSIGDIVAFRRDGTETMLTTHRVIEKGTRESRPYLITKADGNRFRDLPLVSPDQVLGKVVRIERNGQSFWLEHPSHRLRGYLAARSSLGRWFLYRVARFVARLLRPNKEVRT